MSSIIGNKDSFQASISKNWNFKKNNEVISEDIAVFLSLVTKGGENKDPLDKIIMSLVSMFASVEGLYEMFEKRMEGFEFEKKSIRGISIRKYAYSKDFRDAFNYLKVDHKNYVGTVKKLSKIANEEKIYNLLASYSVDFEYEFSLLDNNETKKSIRLMEKRENTNKQKEVVTKEAINNLKNVVVDKKLQEIIINDYEQNRLSSLNTKVQNKIIKSISSTTYDFLFHTKRETEEEEDKLNKKTNDAVGLPKNKKNKNTSVENTDSMSSDELNKKSLEMLGDKRLIAEKENENIRRKEMEEMGKSQEEIEEDIANEFSHNISINEDDFEVFDEDYETEMRGQ